MSHRQPPPSPPPPSPAWHEPPPLPPPPVCSDCRQRRRGCTEYRLVQLPRLAKSRLRCRRNSELLEVVLNVATGSLAIRSAPIASSWTSRKLDTAITVATCTAGAPPTASLQAVPDVQSTSAGIDPEPLLLAPSSQHRHYHSGGRSRFCRRLHQPLVERLCRASVLRETFE